MKTGRNLGGDGYVLDYGNDFTGINISKHQLVLFKYVLSVAYHTSVKLLRIVNTQIFKN